MELLATCKGYTSASDYHVIVAEQCDHREICTAEYWIKLKISCNL